MHDAPLLLYGTTHPHRKCIGFADLQVDFLLQTSTLLHGVMKFQQQLNYEISNIRVTNSDYLATDSEFTTRTD